MSTAEVTLSRLPSADAALLKTPATPASKHAKEEAKWSETANIFEYGAAANPEMAPIPVLVHPPILHESGPTRIIPFDIDDYLEIDHDARPQPDGFVSCAWSEGTPWTRARRLLAGVLRHPRLGRHLRRARQHHLVRGRPVRGARHRGRAASTRA
jgi:hypothetical protein